MLNEDFKDLLSHFIAGQVEFLLVGAYALAAHGLPRATGDIDVWVRPTSDNADRVFLALAAFGAPLSSMTPDTFTEPDIVFQIGVPPRRVDVLTGVSGLTFEEAQGKALLLHLAEFTLPVLSLDDLITNKLASGRPKDRLDADNLEKLRQRGMKPPAG